MPPTGQSLEPLYEPLGIYRSAGGLPRYYLLVRGEVRCFRGWELGCLEFLTDIHPDIYHWRRLFPKRCRSGIDAGAANAFFVKACQERGLYDPPESLKPRRVGRPLKGIASSAT